MLAMHDVIDRQVFDAVELDRRELDVAAPTRTLVEPRDGHTAELVYRLNGKRFVLVHTGVPEALGGHGELVEAPDAIGPALDRAFAHDGLSVVNVLTDPADAYPRSSNLG